MNELEEQASESVSVSEEVRHFYDQYPYPKPIHSLEKYRQLWKDPQRRRAEYHLFWPGRPYREDQSILIAGCGTSQAAKHAMRWPWAQVTGIDFSATSVRYTEKLKQKYSLTSLRSPVLAVADARTQKIESKVGPFDNMIRPFTVNGDNTLVFVNINGLLGFEVGDLRTGKKLYRVEVDGYSQGPVKRHGCPSHGIALTPDEKELWLADCANNAIHVFDATAMPPKQVTSIKVRDCIGWVSFSIDGRFGYSSTGEIIDVKTKKIVATLQDETGRPVQSEKLFELVIENGKVIRAGNQFGVGMKQK